MLLLFWRCNSESFNFAVIRNDEKKLREGKVPVNETCIVSMMA